MSKLHAFLPYIVSVIVAAVLALLQVPEMLGAHPWWAIKVIWIGLPIGVVLAFLLAKIGLSKTLRIAVFVVAVIGAFYAATQGKTVFVNSYAENGLAGRFWYFGWIGTMVAVSGFIASIAQK